MEKREDVASILSKLDLHDIEQTISQPYYKAGLPAVERLFSHAKEWLLLGCLKLRGLEQVAIHACLSFTAMLAVALAAVLGHEPGLMRSIKHFTV